MQQKAVEFILRINLFYSHYLTNNNPLSTRLKKVRRITWDGWDVGVYTVVEGYLYFGKSEGFCHCFAPVIPVRTETRDRRTPSPMSLSKY